MSKIEESIGYMVCLYVCLFLFTVFVQVSSAEHAHGVDPPPQSGKAKKTESYQLSKQSLLILERSILRYTNNERSKHGLVQLGPSSPLNFVARKHSQNMASARILKHESNLFPPGWRKFSERLKIIGVLSGGENIAYHTFLNDLDQWSRLIVEGWMQSPAHKKNILNPDYRYLGVGISHSSDRIAFATQLFSFDRGSLPEGK
jgi:uncharacterized protein YkwD